MCATLVDILVQEAFMRHIGGVLLGTVNTYYFIFFHLLLSTHFVGTQEADFWYTTLLTPPYDLCSTPGTRVGPGTRDRPLAAKAPVGDRKNFKRIEFDKAKTAFSPIA